MAKEQELALNPNKISGQCGRLLCCLAYEYETYCDMKKGLPKCGRKVTVEGREGEVISQHILRQTVTVNFGPQQRIEMTAEEVEKGIMPQKLAAAASAPPERPERSSGQAATARAPERQNREGRQQQQRQRPGSTPGETRNQPQQAGARPQGTGRPQPAPVQSRPAPTVAPEVKTPAKPPQQQQIKRVTESTEGKPAGEQEVRRRRQRNRRRSQRKPGAPTSSESGE
jgi:hypothetical protein